ncbi:MAG: hypothetical protein AAFV90_24165 [Cyanobacteria bacterium J06634_5]
MVVIQQKPVDWDEILETYGPKAKTALYNLLKEHDIPDTDPIALVISALFISQIDSNEAFLSITQTIDSGKEELHQQFEAQVLQLRGVVTYAQEHLVETGKKQVDERKQELLTTIKEGIAKALGNKHKSNAKRNTVNMVAIITSVAATSLISMLASGTAIYSIMSAKTTAPATRTNADWANIPNAELWAEIAVKNDTQLSLCRKNFIKLEGQCAISIPE